MATRDTGPRKPPDGKIDNSRLDAIVAKAHKNASARMAGYREQSLRLFPQVCGRCSREFTAANLHELTVHHKDHNHDNNPADGSNWENLCLYCHDWEHQKNSQQVTGTGAEFGLTGAGKSRDPAPKSATHNPFASLKDALNRKP
jgi:hypothetical protein